MNMTQSSIPYSINTASLCIDMVTRLIGHHSHIYKCVYLFVFN